MKNKSSFTHLVHFSLQCLVIFSMLAALGLGFLPQQRAAAESTGATIVRVSLKGLTTGTCGGTWKQACALQYALTNASPGTEIWVMKGTYKPTTGTDRTISFQLKSGIALYGGFNGNETDRSQRKPYNDSTISGDIGKSGLYTDNSYHVVTAIDADATAVLDGFTITKGYAISSSSPNNTGGGMYISGGSPQISNVYITDNYASSNGGGVSLFSASPTFTNITFFGNYSNNGGGIYIESSPATLTNITFNVNRSNKGGAAYILNSNPLFNNITTFANRGEIAGGLLYNDGSNPIIRNSILWADWPREFQNVNGSVPVITYSDVQGGFTGAGNINSYPYMVGLASYPTMSFLPVLALVPGNPAIDAADGNTCAPNDERGVIRPQGFGCDMGAYEAHGFNMDIVSGDYQDTKPGTKFPKPLALHVSSSYGDPVDGGVVNYSAPGSGASAALSASTVTIKGGKASVIATANAVLGKYDVYADAAGAHQVQFHLANALFSVLYAAPGGSSSGSCESWAHACDLQYALTYAGAKAEIWVKAGTYTPGTDRGDTFQLESTVGVYGGFAGTESNLNQRNPAAHVTILSGEIGAPDASDNIYHVVTGSDAESTAVLDGFTITGGNANGGSSDDSGGGMYNSNGSPTVTNVIFINNHAKNKGGGMANVDYSAPTVNYVTFNNNSADNYGGGMVNDHCAFGLDNATFIGNTAGISGGGMFNHISSMMVTNVTFSGNSANNNGGGMYNEYSSTTLTNVTFSGNSAGYGGAISNNYTSTPTIHNSILWGDTATTNDNEINNYDSTSPATVTYSDVQGAASGTGNISADPLLSSLGVYGNSTPIYSLLPGSPAIDAGSNPVCAATDQRGVNRPQKGHCDMGAFESRGFKIHVISGNNQTANTGATFAHPLVVSVTSAFGEPVNGGKITFVAPPHGASATFLANPVTIVGGLASATVKANDTAGAYVVKAGANGVSAVAPFVLKNVE